MSRTPAIARFLVARLERRFPSHRFEDTNQDEDQRERTSPFKPTIYLTFQHSFVTVLVPAGTAGRQSSSWKFPRGASVAAIIASIEQAMSSISWCSACPIPRSDSGAGVRQAVQPPLLQSVLERVVEAVCPHAPDANLLPVPQALHLVLAM